MACWCSAANTSLMNKGYPPRKAPPCLTCLNTWRIPSEKYHWPIKTKREASASRLSLQQRLLVRAATSVAAGDPALSAALLVNGRAGATSGEAYPHQLTAFHQVEQEVIAGTHFIHQPLSPAPAPYQCSPVATCSMSSVGRMRCTKSLNRWWVLCLDLLLELLPSLFGIFVEQRQRTFVLNSAVCSSDVDLFIFQETIEVRISVRFTQSSR